MERRLPPTATRGRPCRWAINARWPYDGSQDESLPSRNAYYAGNLVETPPPGVVKVTANDASIVLASRKHGRKTLRYVERIKIGDVTLKASRLYSLPAGKRL